MEKIAEQSQIGAETISIVDNHTSAFTGERVIPGEVEADLWNEHIARYHFALPFAKGKRVLDAGCGTGYGSGLLAAEAFSVTGFDISPEAVAYATEHFGQKAKFVQASAQAFPAETGQLDVVTAFEVIEHIDDWEKLIQEAHRVLNREGVFVVSTPNKTYYSEARGDAGPNPFHVHEFEYEEFEAALRKVFPFVRILTQNRNEAIVFSGLPGSEPSLRLEGDTSFSHAHFFLAVCAKRDVDAPAFVYVPSGGNLLQERERHIALLEQQVSEARAQHLDLLAQHRSLEDELKRQNSWALTLDDELANGRRALLSERENARTMSAGYEQKISELDRELKARNEVIGRTQQEAESRLAWVRQLEGELHQRSEELQRRSEYVEQQETLVRERTEWAHRLDKELAERTTWAHDLQKELAARTEWAQGLDKELIARTEWAQRLDQELAVRQALLQKLDSELASVSSNAAAARQERDAARQELSEIRMAAQEADRSAKRLAASVAVVDDRCKRLTAERQLIRQSKWLRLGRRLNLGPNLDNE